LGSCGQTSNKVCPAARSGGMAFMIMALTIHILEALPLLFTMPVQATVHGFNLALSDSPCLLGCILCVRFVDTMAVQVVWICLCRKRCWLLLLLWKESIPELVCPHLDFQWFHRHWHLPENS
jgi:hypothetical protein